MVIPVGAVAIVAWFLVFRFLILKLNLVTPGREDDDELLDEADDPSSAALASGISLRASRSSSMASAVRRTSRAS